MPSHKKQLDNSTHQELSWSSPNITGIFLAVCHPTAAAVHGHKIHCRPPHSWHYVWHSILKAKQIVRVGIIFFMCLLHHQCSLSNRQNFLPLTWRFAPPPGSLWAKTVITISSGIIPVPCPPLLWSVSRCLEAYSASIDVRVCLFLHAFDQKKRDGTASAFSRLRCRRASGLSSSASQTNLHPMCIDLHQQNAAHPKQRLGHLERNSPSPSSQMQFRWVGWPTPPSRVAIFACDVIAFKWFLPQTATANCNFDPARRFHSTTAPFCFEPSIPGLWPGAREVLQTESGSIFGKVRVRVLTGQGQSTHEHVWTESLFCKQKIDFRFHFRFGQFRWRSNWGRSRRFWRKPWCSRVTKWQSGLGEEDLLFLPWLALQGRAGRDW